MDKKVDKMDRIAQKNPFQVPEGYFENLTNQIMEQLPEQPSIEEPKTINLWEKAKPWVYMAAMFAGMALIFKVFISPVDQASSKFAQNRGENKTERIIVSDEEIDAAYDYYENQAALITYYEESYY